VTAATGYDAISHAVETLVSTRGNAFSECFSREAWRLLNSSFERVLSHPKISTRVAHAGGRAFCRAAIENSMLGATHACANPLTAHYDVPHGVAIALLLSHVVDSIVPSRKSVSGSVPGRSAGRLRDLAEAAGCPCLERGQGSRRGAAASARSQRAMTGKFNPRVFDSSAALEIYRCAY